MKIKEMILKLNLEIAAEGRTTEAAGCYIGDMPSRAAAKAPAGGVWITVTPNINIAAAALLSETACIILADGEQPMCGVAEKCRQEGIWLLKSAKGAFELALLLGGDI